MAARAQGVSDVNPVSTRKRQRGTRTVAHFLEPQRGDRPVQFPLQQRHLLIPIIGHQRDILQIPIVVRLAHARRAGLARCLGGNPASKIVRCCLGRCDRCDKTRSGTLDRRRTHTVEGPHHQRTLL